jgi:hypothetical protein
MYPEKKDKDREDKDKDKIYLYFEIIFTLNSSLIFYLSDLLSYLLNKFGMKESIWDKDI